MPGARVPGNMLRRRDFGPSNPDRWTAGSSRDRGEGRLWLPVSPNDDVGG